MGRLDYICDKCNYVSLDMSEQPICAMCGSPMTILWTAPSRSHIGIHSRDRAVVWYNPATGKHATPGRNDIPMPDRYAKSGYERREFQTLRELDHFCKRNNLVNHQANYDHSGRSYDEEG